MFKKSLLALALFLIPSLASAQNITCPTRPLGDSTNACASTQFVQQNASGLPAGANTQIQFNNAGAFGASPNLTWVSPALTVGVAGSTTGQLKLTGATSGTISILGQAAAGTYNFNLPTTAGSASDCLKSGGGGATAMTWGTCGSTSITIGTTTITAGTPTTILYDNAGVVGEYTITGSGTVVAMQTAPTFVTSITTPLIYGGSAAGSVLALQSTSNGVPSGDKITFNTGGAVHGTILSGGFIGFGTETNPQSQLVVSHNVTTGISTPTDALVNFVDVDGSATNIGIGSYGTSVSPGIVFRLARNTAATPQAIQANDGIGNISGRGYDGTQFTTAGKANISFFAAENWSTTAQGSYISFFTTASTTTTRSEVMRIQNSGGVSIGLTTDPGAGILSVLTGFRINNAATTGTILRGNGTNYIASTATYPNTVTANRLLYASATNAISDLASANSSILVTDVSGVPSLSTTLPAHTVTTSITVPLVIGGVGAADTLTLESTSGAGTTDKILFKTASQTTRGTILSNGNIGWGTETNPQVSMALNKSTGTGIANLLGAGSTILQIISEDNATAVSGLYIGAFGSTITGAIPTASFRSARGTASAPTSTQSGDQIGRFGAAGYGTTGFPASDDSGIFFVAQEAFTDSAHGTAITFNTKPVGGNSRVEIARFQPSGGFSVGTTTDPGAGAILTNTFIQTTTYLQVGTKVRATGGAPALSSCGTSPAIEGSDFSGTVTMGTGAPTTCTITFNAAYSSSPRCSVTWRTNIASMQYTVSTTTISLTQTATSSNIVDYICTARSGGWLLNRDLDPAANDNTPAFMNKAA